MLQKGISYKTINTVLNIANQNYISCNMMRGKSFKMLNLSFGKNIHSECDSSEPLKTTGQ